MKVLVVGGGGREHAIVRKLKESRGVTKLYCAPGNGGIAMDAECVNIAATDLKAWCALPPRKRWIMLSLRRMTPWPWAWWTR